MDIFKATVEDPSALMEIYACQEQLYMAHF